MIRGLTIPPELEADEVRVLLWYKSEGETVSPGDALVELETDKAIVLVTANQAGTLRCCFAAASEWLQVGEVAAWLSDEPDEALPPERAATTGPLMARFEVT